MGKINYAPIIRGMTWSYSRVKSFEACPYRWYLRYIRRLSPKEMFFASYGKFMHELIELYCKGEKARERICSQYLMDFQERVASPPPNAKVWENYFYGGLRYLKSMEPLPFRTVATEKRVDFSLDGVPFVGYIDYVGEKDGELVVVDHKSRILKPRSGRKKPTKADGELDEYLRQLYIYSEAIRQEYGRTPKSLCFNCFRENRLITEPFSGEAYKEAENWLLSGIEKITAESDFTPDMEFFKCMNLCEMQDECEYFALTYRR